MADFANPNSDIPLDAPSNDEIIKELDEQAEKDYYKELKKKNKKFLISGLSILERERIAQHIVDLYEQSKTKHKELCDRIDENDEVYRMRRKPIPGDDGDTPNYRTPISTTTLEVIHANSMNVFFTPKDVIRVLPTEEGDIEKIKNLSIFANWSFDNELKIFEQCDRLFHSSAKNGEAPYIVHWVKEYGVEIRREPIRNPANPKEFLYDEETKEPLYQEIEEPKLLFNAPRLETFSRKDYIQPENAMMDVTPEWEMRMVRFSYDKFLREQLQGRMYDKSIDDIVDWEQGEEEAEKLDIDYDRIPLGKWNQEFIEFYGRLRINLIKSDEANEVEEYQELDDEFIVIVHIESKTLCQLRKNKFPMKMRPIGLDYFIPDDEGRRSAWGVIDFMQSIQTCYDALYNQTILGVIQSNNPFGFFTPLGNMRNEPIKVKNGYLFPTADPGSVNIVKLPPPDGSIEKMMDLVRFWAQMLFGIGDYAAGLESSIDPSAPAKKVEAVVAQGSVRLNMIIKRKNKTIQDIAKRWFLLYRDNMPANKFVRIAGEGKEDPWKFQSISMSDFALNSLPDFELTGNILNANKTLEAQKKIGTYQALIQNPLFSPQTQQGLTLLIELTKWFLDSIEETGLSRLLPRSASNTIFTPEEENARMLHGDTIEPAQGEDHVYHLKVHRDMLMDINVSPQVKEQVVVPHMEAHTALMHQQITQQLVMQQTMQPQGVMNGPETTGEGAAPQGVFPEQV